jgi:hypothetical protein
MTKLEQLDIHAAGFAGCDFNDFTQVQLPDGLLVRRTHNGQQGRHASAQTVLPRRHV